MNISNLQSAVVWMLKSQSADFYVKVNSWDLDLDLSQKVLDPRSQHPFGDEGQLTHRKLFIKTPPSHPPSIDLHKIIPRNASERNREIGKIDRLSLVVFESGVFDLFRAVGQISCQCPVPLAFAVPNLRRRFVQYLRCSCDVAG